MIELSIENLLAEPIHLDFGFNRTEAFAIVAKRPDGSVTSRRLKPDGLGRIGRLSIGPNAAYSQQLILNDWLPFDQPGSYRVEVRLTAPIRVGSGNVVSTAAVDVLSIEIDPRNEEILRSTCHRLAAIVIEGRDAGERLFAARALGHVADPVAVPVLKMILERTDFVDWILIEALRRLGTPDARALLAEMAGSAGEERSALARNALERLARDR